MTTLMRNGRGRRSENPWWATRGKNACFCLGPISGSHQGQRPQRPLRDGGKPPDENRPYTWLHPNASQNVRFFLHRERRPYMAHSDRYCAATKSQSLCVRAAAMFSNIWVWRASQSPLRKQKHVCGGLFHP